MGSNEIPSVSTEREHTLEDCVIDMPEDENSIPDCCIYKVDKSLLKIKEEAYTPQFISIGLYHYGSPEFANMEKQKSRYLKEFQKRIGKMKLEELQGIIEKKEDPLRGSYVDFTSDISNSKLTKIILHDAVFIMELFLRNHKIDVYYKQDILLARSRVYYGIKQDLMLLENQLPYFLLEELYNSAFPLEDQDDFPPFLDLACKYFDEDPKELPKNVKIEHFTDLLRCSLIRNCPQTRGKTSGYLRSAAKLHEAGVKFEVSSSTCLLGVTFADKELHVPLLMQDGSTECVIRNVMALEQFHYPTEPSICSYIKLMGLLIKTEKDVELLLEKGIIVHGVGHNGAVANMFHKLCLEIAERPSCYHEIIKELNDHYGCFWKRTWGNLKNVYFSDLWRGTATVAAVILLVLTLIQTACSVIQMLNIHVL